MYKNDLELLIVKSFLGFFKGQVSVFVAVVFAFTSLISKLL